MKLGNPSMGFFFLFGLFSQIGECSPWSSLEGKAGRLLCQNYWGCCLHSGGSYFSITQSKNPSVKSDPRRCSQSATSCPAEPHSSP